MPRVYPYASEALIEQTLETLEAQRIGQQEVTLLKQILVAAANSGTPLPPSVAPVLVAEVDFGSYDVHLSWTQSNRNAQYNLYSSNNGVDFFLSETTSATFTTYSAGETPATWYFYVTPFNDSGEGPSSNTVSVNVPGESSASYYRRPDGVSLYLRPDSSSLYLRP